MWTHNSREQQTAERRENNFHIRNLKRVNQDLPPGQKAVFSVRNRKLFVNNEQKKKKVIPPTVADIMNLTREEFDRINSLEMVSSSGVEDKGSHFTAYATKISTVNEIADYYRAVKMWHPEADHIVMAYMFDGDIGSCDDGEHSAGVKVMKTLEDRSADKVVVFIAREHRDPNIGARRFVHILAQAREAMNKL